MIKKTLQIEKKARYFQLGNPGNDTSIVWVVLHGYGMLSEFFIQKFKKLENKNTLILAPEALNRFYIDTNYGRVGASWMTKDERQDDIKENIKYLNSLMDQIIKEIGHNRFKINVLGFSQGGATACRWLFKSGLKFENLIMWAGDIPKDTLTEENRLKWNDMNTHLVMGKKDELINEEMKAKFLKLVTDYKLDYKLTLYDGDHRIYPDVLMELIKSFD
ncbi:MAG: phospholipase [Flavobacteriaceae bacterium]|nr:phospholipase [Flavobacteriaceae bacterium]